MLRKLIFIYATLVSVALNAQSLKVMTYNIRYDNPNDGVNQWSHRKSKVFELLKKYNPDIIGVQEALHHQLTDITKKLPQYEYVGVGRDDGKAKGEYSALLFRKNKFSVIEHNTFWLSETPEQPGSKSWDAAITRVATWAKLRDKRSGKTFLIVNTHFDHIGEKARVNSAALLKKKIAELKGDLPVIITGDFNCKREDPPYQTLLDETTGKIIDPAPATPPGTFCDFKVNSMECIPIDYIFNSPEWRATHYEVITDHDGEHYPSDHLPVTVVLHLNK